MANTVKKAINQLDALRATLQQLANNLGVADKGISKPKRPGGGKPRKPAKPKPR